jgi:hypothetical protein
MDSHKFQKLSGGLFESRVCEKELFLSFYIESIRAPMVGFKSIPVCVLIETFVKKIGNFPFPSSKQVPKVFSFNFKNPKINKRFNNL